MSYLKDDQKSFHFIKKHLTDGKSKAFNKSQKDIYYKVILLFNNDFNMYYQYPGIISSRISRIKASDILENLEMFLQYYTYSDMYNKFNHIIVLTCPWKVNDM